jgi:hypothetical protein
MKQVHLLSELGPRSANCLLNIFHQIQNSFQSTPKKVAGMRSMGGQDINSASLVHKHKLSYHYANVYIFVQFLEEFKLV